MRFLKGDFNAATGISTVVIEHMNHEFIGTAKLHPEDINFGSSYTGCTLAELRATIKALKYERKQVHRQTKEWTRFLNACTGCKKFNRYSNTAKVVFRQYNRQVKYMNDLAEEIKKLKNDETTIIKTRDKYIKKRKAEVEEKAKQVNVL